jgi:predicted nucleic acid-binding protein
MANSVFLDANILMEMLFERAKASDVASNLRALPDDDLLVLSIFSVNVIFYYVEKYGFPKATAHEFIKNYKVLDMNEADYGWARDNDVGDFEDALQIACARRHACAKLITLDQDMDKQYGKYMLVETII